MATWIHYSAADMFGGEGFYANNNDVETTINDLMEEWNCSYDSIADKTKALDINAADADEINDVAWAVEKLNDKAITQAFNDRRAKLEKLAEEA